MTGNMGLHKLRAWVLGAVLDASHAPVNTIAAVATATASVYLLPGYILMFLSGPRASHGCYARKHVRKYEHCNHGGQ